MSLNIPFEKLLESVESLNDSQKALLRQKLGEDLYSAANDKMHFIEMLKNGPVYSEKEIAIIEGNRNSIRKWRTKD